MTSLPVVTSQVVFFDGFNFSDSEATTLNPAYWSNNSGYGFQGARTGNGVALPNRAMNTALSGNSWLKLSNFTNPLATYSCLGVGFYVQSGGGLRSGLSSNTAAPDFENLMSLTTSNGTLSVDVGRPGDNNGALLVVRENGTTINTYDFRSAPGNSWNHTRGDFGWGLVSTVDTSLYLDFFFDAANGSFAVRAAGGNTLSTPLYNANGSATTAISSFSSVSELKLYGHMNIDIWNNGQRRVYDDFYFTAGNALSAVFLGPNTRIYRLGVQSTASNNWQTTNGNDPAYVLSGNDGDNQYIKSAAGGEVSALAMGNLPGDAPAYVSGVKVLNVVRKAGLDNQSLVNVMSTSGDTPQEIGPTYSITSETYGLKETTFLTNPITSSDWTTSEVNNMVLGVKNKTVVI
jgi:hypothetical protein